MSKVSFVFVDNFFLLVIEVDFISIFTAECKATWKATLDI